MAYRLTDRMKRVVSIASEQHNCLNSCQLLNAMLNERTGVLNDLYCHLKTKDQTIEDVLNYSHIDDQVVYFDLLECQLTKDLSDIIDKAIKLMTKYNQVYLNEGHILRYLLKHDKIKNIFEEDLLQRVLNLTTRSRDMKVDLCNYEKQDVSHHNYRVRYAKPDDRVTIEKFVHKHFNKTWAVNILNGIDHNHSSVYIALKDNKIIGFAGYDVVGHNKGNFGPMGVDLSVRSKQVGKKLLFACLNDMKERGYDHVVIIEAGPQEFYEKTCHAVLI